MNLSDLPRRDAAAAGATQPLDPQALTAQLGSEVAGALTAALERVTALAATGRIDRESLHALRDEIDRARRAGIVGQQIVRLAAGHVQQAQERVDLTALLREALRQRAREIGDRGIELRQQLAAATVTSDSTLVFALLQALLDWCFRHALARVDLTLEAGPGLPARVTVAFAHRPAEVAADAQTQPMPLDGPQAPEPTLDTMPWRLLQQIATLLEVALARSDTPTRSAVVIAFPVPEAVPGGGTEAAAGDDDGFDIADAAGPDPFEQFAEFGTAGVSAAAAQPLAGRHVLVLAARRDVRTAIRDALRPLSMMVDFVYTVEDAHALCADAAPDAVVWEASLGGERLDRLRAALSVAQPAPAFVEIAEDGREEVLGAGPAGARIGRDALGTSLPAALTFELARARDRRRGR